MKFWIIVNGQQQGPFEQEQLSGMNITRETMVWTEGMANWATAENVPALDFLWANIPPNPQPVSPVYPQPQYLEDNVPERPTNWLPLAIVSAILCCFIFSIPAIINAARSLSLYNQGDYDGAYEASKKARTWTIVSAIVAIAFFIMYFGWIFSFAFDAYDPYDPYDYYY